MLHQSDLKAEALFDSKMIEIAGKLHKKCEMNYTILYCRSNDSRNPRFKVSCHVHRQIGP
jgi:hypothetical protein